MLGHQYINVIQRLATAIDKEEMPKIAGVAEKLNDVVLSGGAVFLFDNGHMLNHELFNRAGGLAMLGQFTVSQPAYSASVVRAVDTTSGVSKPGEDIALSVALARRAVEVSGIRAGDALIIGSVSGRSPFVVELARAARQSGIYTVAMTAKSYASTLPPIHPDGLLMNVCVDCLDIHTSVGDAELSVDGLDEKLGPSSGLMAALVSWCLVAELTERLLAAGRVPTVFRSVNYPDGPERYQAQVQRYRQLGY